MESLTPQTEVAPLQLEKCEPEAEAEGEHGAGEDTVSGGSPTPQPAEDHVRQPHFTPPSHLDEASGINLLGEGWFTLTAVASNVPGWLPPRPAIPASFCPYATHTQYAIRPRCN